LGSTHHSISSSLLTGFCSSYSFQNPSKLRDCPLIIPSGTPYLSRFCQVSCFPPRTGRSDLKFQGKTMPQSLAVYLTHQITCAEYLIEHVLLVWGL
jgi:hypothetical protein